MLNPTEWVTMMGFHKSVPAAMLMMALAAFAANHAAADDISFCGAGDFVNQDATFDLASFGAKDELSDCSTCYSSCPDPCCPNPWVVSREPICSHSQLDWLTELATKIDNGDNFKMPFSGGAWHWFHQSLIGRPGGYGIPTIRDTYFWYLYADPEYTTAAGNQIGGHMELRFRETDTFRSFVDDQIWTWELYGYLHNDDLGTLKAGQLFNRFGVFWDGSFFGNAAYFDGLKLDADYGLSWEKSTEVHDCLQFDSYLQFFFHEDQSNGSFPGADPESVVGYTEKNTGVARMVSTWTRADGSQLAAGASALVGQIDSQIALPDTTEWAYGFDATYTKGRWKAVAEGSQMFGVRNPKNFASGGASDQLTNFLAGMQYTRGAVTYRAQYSNSIYENPHAVQNFVLAGTTIKLTPDIDLYIEYVNQRVDGATKPGQNRAIFHGLEWIINWNF